MKSKNTFDQLYDEYFDPIVRFCNGYVVDIDVAKDITQDSFIKFYKNYKKGKDKNSYTAYLYVIARNLCLNYIRDNKKNDKNLKDNYNEIISEKFLLDEITKVEVTHQINKAIDSFTPRYKEIAKLILLEYTNSEIANKLNISINTVKSNKKEIYSKLRKIFNKDSYAFIFYLFFKEN